MISGGARIYRWKGGEGAGKDYGQKSAAGSLNNYIFKNEEFAVNEAPLSAFSAAEWDSVSQYNDAAIMVIGRVCGEGKDLPVVGASDAGGNMLSISAEEKDILRKLAELKAAGSLNWAVNTMMDRYNKFAEIGAKDLKSYNARVENLPYESEQHKKMPQIIIIIDELADLMMVAQSEVEDAICRLAQLARAAGIHLIIATQRPSVNVITGLIKANMPSRIAFAV
mgnify:CR=1 FL=1